ncbi:MAG: DsrE family protein [SAR324 cluster bacterium]|nr:DsrE family protein [SAR324 cluster bacterium]MCZ6558851.1 DsrE family protein [SAR324 cluster bacterium]
MTTILNVIERAYQGTLEEQDDQVLWLVHALKNAGAEQAVLLRGPATAYAVANQSVDPLRIGGVETGDPPAIDQDLKRLTEKGVAVWVVKEDAEERGIGTADVLPEVQWVPRKGVAGLFQQAGRVFAW